MRRERFEAIDVVRGQEIVDVAERRLHAARQRLVAGRAEQRVQPDQPPAAAPQPRHLAGEHIRFAAIPSV